METVVKFEDSFALCGGIHLPKLVKCISSTGQVYKQLVKSEDDLRQVCGQPPAMSRPGPESTTVRVTGLGHPGPGPQPPCHHPGPRRVVAAGTGP